MNTCLPGKNQHGFEHKQSRFSFWVHYESVYHPIRYSRGVGCMEVVNFIHVSYKQSMSSDNWTYLGHARSKGLIPIHATILN